MAGTVTPGTVVDACRIVQGNIMTKMAPSAWKDIVPQHDKDLLQWATALKVNTSSFQGWP